MSDPVACSTHESLFRWEASFAAGISQDRSVRQIGHQAVDPSPTRVYVLGRVRMLVGAIALALTLAASPPDACAAGDECRKACTAMGNAALVQGCDGCATGLIDDRDACVKAARNEFASCVAACPAFAGFCAITHDCVNRCRDGITSAQAVCERTFRSHFRRRCAG